MSTTEPTLRLTESQLRLIVFQTSRAYALARQHNESEQACEWKRARALELSLLEIAEGRSGQGRLETAVTRG